MDHHMVRTWMERMMIATWVIAMVTALPLTWTRLMDATASAPRITQAVTALSLQFLVPSWLVATTGTTVSLVMVGAVRQKGTGWLHILGLEKPQKSASARAI
jgi:hypothetical protein